MTTTSMPSVPVPACSPGTTWQVRKCNLHRRLDRRAVILSEAAVILSAAKDLRSTRGEILRCTQDDIHCHPERSEGSAPRCRGPIYRAPWDICNLVMCLRSH